MLRIGDYNELEVKGMTELGVLLCSEEGDLLLPKGEGTVSPEETPRLRVFVYPGPEDELLATLKTPKARVGEFAYLEVKDINRYGAFLDWGLPKDLFVPYNEQRYPLKKGQRYIVFLYKDQLRNRVAATTKIEKHLIRDRRPPFFEGEEVELLVYEFTPLGVKVIVENRYQGLIFKSESYQELQVGDRLQGYVQRIRDDDKLDISLRKIGRQGRESAREVILAKLREHHSYLPLNDDSSPEKIKEWLQMSKNTFKKAIGGLYKDRQIEFADGGIVLKDTAE